MSSSAAAGPVALDPLTPIAFTMPVGSFARSQKLDVTPRRAGVPAAFTMSFSPKMKLVANDTVTFTLRNVVGSTSDLCVGPALGHLPKISRESWILEKFQLILTVGSSDIQIDKNMSIVVPSSAGLMVPSEGMMSKTKSFTVSANVKDGSIPLLPLTHVLGSPAIGVLNETQISFDIRCTGEKISEFNLSFRKKGRFVSICNIYHFF